MKRNQNQIYGNYDLRMEKSFERIKLAMPEYKVILKTHPAASPEMFATLGYYPTGKYQIIVIRGERMWSIVKGMTSFGLYEIMRVEPREDDPHRIGSIMQVISHIREDTPYDGQK